MPRAVEAPLLSSSSGSDASDDDSSEASAAGRADEKVVEKFRLQAKYWWGVPAVVILSVAIFVIKFEIEKSMDPDLDLVLDWPVLFICLGVSILLVIPKLYASKLAVSPTGLTYTKPSIGLSCGWSSMTVDWADVASIGCKSVLMTYRDHHCRKRKYRVDSIVIMLTPEARKEKYTYLSTYLLRLLSLHTFAMLQTELAGICKCCTARIESQTAWLLVAESRYFMEQCSVDLAFWMFALGMSDEDFVAKLNALKVAQDPSYVPPVFESSSSEEEDIESGGEAAGTNRCFKVVFPQGTVARAGVKMGSEKRGVLAKGATIKAVAVREITHNGKKVTRVQLEVRGCVSNCVVGRRD